MSNTDLIAHNGALKRSKCKSRRVNTPRPEIALKSNLWEEYQVQPHPYLKGVLCRDDGCIFVPASGTNKAHWTYGTRDKDGYRYVRIFRKNRKVHRLVCEAFHGLPPAGKAEVDHINRRKDDNRPENLRWCNRSENNRNTLRHETSVAKYGVSATDDENAYRRARWRNDPEYRERRKARTAAYHAARREERKAYAASYAAEKKAQGLSYRKGADGKHGWYPRIRTTNQNKEI